MIASLDDNLNAPENIQSAGLEYFLESSVVSEVCEVFDRRTPTSDEKVRLLLSYAEDDAYPDWVYGGK